MSHDTMSTQEIAAVPADNGLILSALGPEDRAALLKLGRPKSYPKGMTIFTTGEPASMMLVIQSGRVEVSVGALTGRRTIFNQMGAGEVLGDLATLDGGARSADAVAASDVTGLILTRQQVMEFLTERPKVAILLMQELCRKLRNLSDLYAAQSLSEGPGRLARALLKLFDKWGEPVPGVGTRMTEAFSQTDIGDFASLARENVNRYLRAWTEAGWIEADGRRLVLKDRAAIEDLADL